MDRSFKYVMRTSYRLRSNLSNCTHTYFKQCSLCAGVKTSRFSTGILCFVDLHPGKNLVNNQLDAQFFMYVYFYSLHVSGSHVPIIRRITVSMRHLVYVILCRRPFSMQVNLHTRRSSTQSDKNQVSQSYNNSSGDGDMAARNV